jgi:hypothetical protein
VRSELLWRQTCARHPWFEPELSAVCGADDVVSDEVRFVRILRRATSNDRIVAQDQQSTKVAGTVTPMTREFSVTVAGGTITAWQRGSGPHTLLLHGGPGISDYTESLAVELEDAYTVTRYQQRGVAPSTEEGPFDVETNVADAIAVMDRVGIDKAFLLGHSWGGYLALHLAIAHQDRFLAMVPIDPLGAIGPDGGVQEMG